MKPRTQGRCIWFTITVAAMVVVAALAMVAIAALLLFPSLAEAAPPAQSYPCTTDLGTLSAEEKVVTFTDFRGSSCASNVRDVYFTFTVSEEARLSARTSSGRNSRGQPFGVSIQLQTSTGTILQSGSGSAVSGIMLHRTVDPGDYRIYLRPGAIDRSTFTFSLRATPPAECTTDLGELTDEAISVKVDHYPGSECSPNTTRKYTFHVVFPSVVAATAMSTDSAGAGVIGMSMKLRPETSSDRATPLAMSGGTDADIYQSVSSGHYRINLEKLSVDGGYMLTLQAFGQPNATPTPRPDPTPRYQPNTDIRLEPDPRGVAYETNRPYVFRVEGAPKAFPVTVRMENSPHFGLTSGASGSVNCSAPSEVTEVAHLAQVTLHVCAEGVGANLRLLRASDEALLAAYSIIVPSGAPTDPGGVPGPPDSDPGDRIKLGELVRTVCEAGNLSCNVKYLKDMIGVSVAGMLFFAPTAVARGRVSPASSGIGIAFVIIGLFLAHRMVGVPLEWAAMALVAICFLGGIMLYLKFRRVGS